MPEKLKQYFPVLYSTKMPSHTQPVKIVECTREKIMLRTREVGAPPPTPKHACQLPPQLPSRVSRRGLPCPEEHDTPYTDWKMVGGGGWITVDSKLSRDARRGAPCLLED
jgi:hypothetical protein